MATTGPQLGARRGAEVLYEPVLKVPGQGSAGPSWSAGLVGLPVCTVSSAFAVRAGWRERPGVPPPWGAGWGDSLPAGDASAQFCHARCFLKCSDHTAMAF